jgi:hypothetical protein
MRAVNRVAAAVLGLVLLVVGLMAAAELALVATGASPWPRWLADWLSRWPTTTFSDGRILALAIIIAAVGLLILIAQARRWRPDRLPTGDARQGVWWLSRRAVERRTAARADALVGVHEAEAKVRGGARRWRLRVRAAALADQREPVEQALRGELHKLDLPDELPLDLALRPPKRVA